MKRTLIRLFTFSITFAVFINTLAIAQTKQTGESKEGNSATRPIQRVINAKTIEKSHFEFLSTLNTEEPKKSGKLLGRLSRPSKDLQGYKIQEYRSYLKTYFPDASSDHVHSFMIESYISQKKWDEAKVSLLKFAYIYPNSSVHKKVMENGYTLLQEEKYYASDRDKLLTLLQEAPQDGKIPSRYFEFLSTVHSLKDKKLTSIFKRESWEFLALYSNQPRASIVLMWLAQLEQTSNSYHSALMIYEKLMALYPGSKDYAAALYQVALLKQEQFGEFNEATVSFRKFLNEFPEHKYVTYSQYRIATIADQNFKDWTTAVKEYDKLVAKHPSFTYAIPSLLRIGEIQATKLKLKDEAISTYNRVATEYPDNTSQVTVALKRAGKLYEKSKEYEKAIEQYMVIHDKYPGTDGALASLEDCAVIYEKKLKQDGKAVEMLNTVIKEFPDSKNAKKAAKRIKKINK